MNEPEFIQVKGTYKPYPTSKCFWNCFIDYGLAFRVVERFRSEKEETGLENAFIFSRKFVDIIKNK